MSYEGPRKPRHNQPGARSDLGAGGWGTRLLIGPIVQFLTVSPAYIRICKTLPYLERSKHDDMH